MNLTALLASKLLILFLGALASYMDIKTRSLPNWLCGITFITGLVAATLVEGPEFLSSHLIHSVLALIGGMILFALRMVGGGDAKFYAAVAAWFTARNAAALLLTVALSGVILFLCWFVWRRAQGKPIRGSNSEVSEDKLPFGIAIAAGAAFLFWQTGA